MNHYIRLPLEGTFNTRDIGGYACADGHVTKFGAFLRSDDLSNLTERDFNTLHSYGLVAVIDLRGPSELAYLPSPCQKRDGIEYINVSLMKEAIGTPADITRTVTDFPEDYLKSAYLGMLEGSKPEIAEVFRFIANCKPGCVLFNCTAGKDRTGITAALLLGLAGVSKIDILVNYLVTQTYLQENKRMQSELSNIPVGLRYSRLEYMEPALELISTKYGGFKDYLLSTGLSDNELTSVRSRFIE